MEDRGAGMGDSQLSGREDRMSGMEDRMSGMEDRVSEMEDIFHSRHPGCLEWKTGV